MADIYITCETTNPTKILLSEVNHCVNNNKLMGQFLCGHPVYNAVLVRLHNEAH